MKAPRASFRTNKFANMLSGLRRMHHKVWSHPANQDRRIRQLTSAIRFHVACRVTGRPVQIRVGEHSRLWASLDNGPSILAAYAPQPDYAEWNVWRRHLRAGDTFVDVGANVGIYSVLAGEIPASVIAVEPHPHNVERLRRNLELNGLRAEIWEAALTATPGTVHFSADLDAENHITHAGGMDVRGMTYDSVIGLRYVAGMKVDVEGAERLVLEGATQALRERRIALLQLEWNGTSRSNFGESRELVGDLLQRYGYSLYRPDPEGRLLPSDSREGSDMFAAHPADVAHLLSS